MSLTTQDREWLNRRDELTAPERAVCDTMLVDAAFSSKSYRVPLVLYDDRAAAFEAACVRFIITSRPE